MHSRRTVPLLIAAVVGLGAITVALAAVLISDNKDEPAERVSPNTAGATSPTQAPSATAEADQPDGIPDDVWTDLQDLPQKLRDDLIAHFEAQQIAVADIEAVIEQYANRDQSVRVGTVLEATDTRLRLEVYTTGEQAEVALNDETVLKRGHDDITPADLQPDELVMVLSRDGGATAFAVTAFGVGAP